MVAVVQKSRPDSGVGFGSFVKICEILRAQRVGLVIELNIVETIVTLDLHLTERTGKL